jgi:hypothetical protein
MDLTITTTQDVLNHHLAAFIDGDIEEMLKDYTEDSVVWTADAEFKGKDAIAFFFGEVYKIMPKGSTKLDVLQTFIKDGTAYIAWKGDSPFVNIPAAADTFVIKDEKIVIQAIGAHIVPKS